MRHCFRVPHPEWDFAGPGHSTDPNDYAANPWPRDNEWDAPPMECTRGGKHIARQAAHELAPLLRHYARIVVIADTTTHRDVATADELVAGLREVNASLPIVEAPDAAVYQAYCDKVPPSKAAKYTEKALHRTPRPSHFKALLKRMQELLGHGKEYMLGMRDSVSRQDGELQGRTFVAHSVAENLLMEEAAGMQVGWGHASEQDVMDMQRLHLYYRAVADRNPGVAYYWNSNLLWTLTNELLAPSAGGASDDEDESSVMTIYVGHDGNIDGLTSLLNLEYVDPLWGDRAAPPDGGLWFDFEPASSGARARWLDGTRTGARPSRLGGTSASTRPAVAAHDERGFVRVSFFSVKPDPTATSHEVSFTPVTFDPAPAARARLHAGEFRARVENRVWPECIKDHPLSVTADSATVTDAEVAGAVLVGSLVLLWLFAAAVRRLCSSWGRRAFADEAESTPLVQSPRSPRVVPESNSRKAGRREEG